MKKTICLVSLCLLLVSVLAVWLMNSNTSSSVQASNLEKPFEAFNRKAKLARTGEMPATREFVDEMFRVTSAEIYISGLSATNIKDRLSRAESRYRQGQISGISEITLVRSVNSLARSLALPLYAKTNPFEVRKLRTSLFNAFPQVIGSGQTPQTSIASEMSPAEAFFVTAMLLQQKTSNPEYQISHAERRANWNEIGNLRRGNEAIKESYQRLTANRPAALQRAIRQGFVSMSPIDVVRVPETTLDNLGVER